MRRTLILACLGFFAFGGITWADSYILVVKSATIAATKANGSCWDCGFTPTQCRPDPYVLVKVYDAENGLADSGQTFVAWNTFTPVWSQEKGTVKAGWWVSLQVWDKDIKYDDEIGTHSFYITEAMLKAGEVSLTFGQVERITLAFRATQKPASAARVILNQPYPGPFSAKNVRRTKGRDLAVILLHGLDLRDDGTSPAEPRLHDWQGSTSPLVRTLSKHGDVFAVCYTQTAAIEEIATYTELRESIKKVKDLGYKQIVLLGHSAGGLLARHFVEDHPSAGVTRVIQVATPNGGAGLAEWGVRLGQVPKGQASFVKSLSKSHRAALLKSRGGRAIPSHIDFVTVLSCTVDGARGDNIVSRRSQWSPDLQQQCVPCVCVKAGHLEVMVHDDCLDKLSALVSQKQVRWSSARVGEVSTQLGLAR
ncbi:MAG: hypothetical protein HYX68_17325 [Planctomycetes bacterium]|nr:hypothetical protein [Planctomycetota bacterium]